MANKICKSKHSRCTPLKITARLVDGRVNSSDGLFFIDAILYHAWFLIHAPEVLNGTQQGDTANLHIGLPLLQLQGNRYGASCGFYHVLSREIEHWRKRPDFSSRFGEYASDNVRQINTSSGQLRAYDVPNPILVISDPVFYVIGNKGAIEEMLALIPAIGKKPAMGWGSVARWDVECIDEDYTTIGPYGLMRPVPIDEFPCGLDKAKYHIRQCGIKPPYWKHKNQTLCYMPEVEI